MSQALVEVRRVWVRAALLFGSQSQRPETGFSSLVKETLQQEEEYILAGTVDSQPNITPQTGAICDLALRNHVGSWLQVDKTVPVAGTGSLIHPREFTAVRAIAHLSAILLYPPSFGCKPSARSEVVTADGMSTIMTCWPACTRVAMRSVIASLNATRRAAGPGFEEGIILATMMVASGHAASNCATRASRR